jgi:hypothetical protein
MKGAIRRSRKPGAIATLAVALAWLVPPALAEETQSTGLAPRHLAFPAETQLEFWTWNKLEGWQQDDHAAAFATFRASCDPLARRLRWLQRKDRPPKDSRPMKKALMEVCARAMKLEKPDAATAKSFFEENFLPVQVGPLGEDTGLLTGYYEPIIEGSRFPSYEYTVPVDARAQIGPDALAAVGHGEPNRTLDGRASRFGAVPLVLKRDHDTAARPRRLRSVEDQVEQGSMDQVGVAEDGNGAGVQLRHDAHVPGVGVLPHHDEAATHDVDQIDLAAGTHLQPGVLEELREQSAQSVRFRQHESLRPAPTTRAKVRRSITRRSTRCWRVGRACAEAAVGVGEHVGTSPV